MSGASLNKSSETTGNPIRILFMAAEAEPFVKVGGLGDVAGSLPQAIRSIAPSEINGRQFDIRLILPLHPVIARDRFRPDLISTFKVAAHAGRISASVYQTEIQGMQVYLVDGSPVRKVKTVYGANNRLDGDKFLFFCQAALELCGQIDWNPHIIHVNDWHTAVVPHLLKTRPEKYPGLSLTRTVLTIHNLPFMGAGIDESLQKFGISPSDNANLPPWAISFPLPMGLAAADRITAVSPNYSSELFTEGFGCGLQGFLETIRSKISGILNGIDTRAWDPSTDSLISHPFSVDNLAARKGNRDALIREFHLNPDPAIPLLTFIGRMDIQKGVDLLLESLPAMTDQPWQAVIIGSGAEELENKCRELEARHPERVRAVIRYDAELSHRLYAGSDMIVIPSRYEPCGLVQMIAMRYGCVPVASAVGGLADTIIDHPEKEESTGFLFSPPTAPSLKTALSRAISTYSHKKAWEKIQWNGMQNDFSWRASALEYARIYLDEYQAAP